MPLSRRQFLCKASAAALGLGATMKSKAFASTASDNKVGFAHLDDQLQFLRLKELVEQDNPGLRISLVKIDGEDVLQSQEGGMRVFWILRGRGEVFLPKGYRTQEGDGDPLPKEYAPDKPSPALVERLRLIKERLASVSNAALTPVRAILGRWKGEIFSATISAISGPWNTLRGPGPTMSKWKPPSPTSFISTAKMAFQPSKPTLSSR